MIKEKDRAKQQAKAQLSSIIGMVVGMESTKDDDKQQEAALRIIQEDPLSVEVRTGWYTPGSKDNTEPAEYNILLCTGGPACRIIGDLDRYGEPESARIEYQDWGTPWTEYRIDSEEEAKVLLYARQFFFGS